MHRQNSETQALLYFGTNARIKQDGAGEHESSIQVVPQRKRSQDHSDHPPLLAVLLLLPPLLFLLSSAPRPSPVAHPSCTALTRGTYSSVLPLRPRATPVQCVSRKMKNEGVRLPTVGLVLGHAPDRGELAETRRVKTRGHGQLCQPVRAIGRLRDNIDQVRGRLQRRSLLLSPGVSERFVDSQSPWRLPFLPFLHAAHSICKPCSTKKQRNTWQPWPTTH